MKKLLTTIAAGLCVAWIAVPVAGADVYSLPKPQADVYGSSSSRLHPHDVYQTSSWNRIHLRQTADVNERG